MELVARDDPALHTIANRVPDNEDVTELVAAMFDVMSKHGGIGLAANQLGQDKRVICIKARGFKAAVINPTVHPIGSAMRGSIEGCLSFPGLQVTVKRYQKVRLTGYDEHWNPVSYKLKSLESFVAQHEVDHLDGVTLESRQASKG